MARVPSSGSSPPVGAVPQLRGTPVGAAATASAPSINPNAGSTMSFAGPVRRSPIAAANTMIATCAMRASAAA